jgi:glycosidase
MRRRHFSVATAVALVVATAAAAPGGAVPARDNAARRARNVYEARLADWRNHQVVYQVFVDRFAPSTDPESRREFYGPPRRLRHWSEPPTKGTFLEDAQVWSHEFDFWGGDLRGLTERLDYIKSLGCNVVYLNPIFLAFTNHKYDTIDYFKIDPQYGTREDFDRLCTAAHERGMRVVLDGVFNHTGRQSVWFKDAAANPASPYRDFYSFGKDYKNGYIGWVDLANLPELNYANPAVRQRIYAAPDSVVQSYLKSADGWRLDVAFELGPQVLSELTESAHRAKADSYTTGEIYNYPADWFPALDGVMNMYESRIILLLAQGQLSGPRAGEMVDALVADAGIEPLLRSWIVLSNHDRPRLRAVLPEERDRAFAWALAVALPGSPLVYYGEEFAIPGKDDPDNRAPMPWDLLRVGPPKDFEVLKALLAIRNSHRALEVGDFVRLPSAQLLAFARMTDSVRDTVVVVANPTDAPLTETIGVRDGWLQDDSPLRDLLTGAEIKISAGLLAVTVPPKSVQMYAPVVPTAPGYNRYKRIP